MQTVNKHSTSFVRIEISPGEYKVFEVPREVFIHIRKMHYKLLKYEDPVLFEIIKDNMLKDWRVDENLKPIEIRATS